LLILPLVVPHSSANHYVATDVAETTESSSRKLIKH
jgi:hypothetical protein